jgi:hypothetical protein
MLIQHPNSFKEGTRVLMLKSRHKDGITDERTITRVTHSLEQFDRELGELIGMLQPNERIYASAAKRSIGKAVRLFKQRQLDADYDDDPQRFYRALQDRWVSCLMAPTSEDDKLWLFDCDTIEETDRVRAEIQAHYDRPWMPYSYQTKNGTHILVTPFNIEPLTVVTCKLIHKNPIILWAY